MIIMKFFIFGITLSFFPLQSLAVGKYNSIPQGQVKFKSGFMKFYEHGINLEDFDGEDTVKAGKYYVEMNLNSKNIESLNVNFIETDKEQGIQPCFTPKDILAFGVRLSMLPQDWQSNGCILINDIIPDATITFDDSDQKLYLTIPQVYVESMPNGYIRPELWDEGVPALTLAYSFNASNYKNSSEYNDHKKNKQFYYGSLNTSAKLGPWRFYTNGMANSSSDESVTWNNQSAYIQRSFAANQSQFILGDVNTTGAMFNTTPLRGASLYTDDRMLPNSMRGYAPVIRGVADSNALVTIRQNGNVIHETNVPPGEFIINDLNTAGYGGNLEVTIREANGNIRVQVVPYSSIPQLLREGYSRYTATVGEIRSSNLSDPPMLFEGSYQYGFNNYITGYGGIQKTISTDYFALLGGVAFNTPIGALSFDATRSSTSVKADDESQCDSTFCNMSFKVSLAKVVEPTKTNFSLMAYRYSSSNYFTLMDALNTVEAQKSGKGIRTENYREVLEANINQNLSAGWGSLFLTTYYGRYWHKDVNEKNTLNYQVGYANSVGSVNYSLGFNRLNNRYGNGENTLRLSLSIPLDTASSYRNRPRLTSTISHNDRESRLKTVISGTVGEHQEYNYGSWIDGTSNSDRNFGVNGGYSGNTSLINLGYSQGRSNSMASVNLSSGIVVHAGGVNLSHSISDTLGIIEAKGATGASIYPYTNARVAKNGYAILPYLSPFQYNDISLNVKDMPTNIEIEEDRIKIVPTAGASVLVKFDTKNINNQILKVKNEEGHYIPFGANAYNAAGDSLGVVGQGGNIILSSEKSQSITIVWNSKEGIQKCFINYIPELYSDYENIKIVNTICRNESSQPN